MERDEYGRHLGHAQMGDGSDGPFGVDLLVDDDHPANVVHSFCMPGWHHPVLDLDFPARLLPSSTPGHFHLYLDGIEISWEKYAKLLTTLAEVGIISEGYLDAALQRGYTSVRLQGVTK